MRFGSILKKNQRLKALNEDDPEYQYVKKLFDEGWKHPNKSTPTVRSIFKLLKTPSEMGEHHSYRSSIVAEVGDGVDTSGLFFHGTNRACALGDRKINDELCNNNKCNLCGIIRSSYDLAKSGSKHKFSRFGRGIYTSACSSKADDYFRDLATCKLQSRALLVNAVVYGKPQELSKTDTSANPCGSGYHSVMGVTGGDLNYEETVVYTNEAIRPVYLVTYGTHSERVGKLRKRA
ncbi:hypothetical protein BJ322DRAFT_394756 [Thelephora terrestris]|jgi:hypothetical protein|uniref:PARP catalytic domain-containing protein n=1 Tax=Thelephora terrestris TaxID=56493 RepID=A0A9P6LAV3_9AGAM|nr:hypothetical protein BJ322DRAFT_394756 [Thelephora terrestris]